jgi:glycosyltransferase involved in cell wall biosynthesis
VLPNPVDTRHFHACPEARRRSREALGFAPDDVVVGFVGRIEPEKGVHVLARALDRVMADCPRVRALWVGHGRSWDELRAATAAGPHAARHRWHGWSADVFPLYAAMDLLALPSVGPETFGRVLVEAQACGVPVLGSALGGIPEALEPGITGLLLPPGDVDAWTSAVAELAEDPRRRSFMGWAGRRFVCGQFESGQIASRFGALLAAGAAALSA